MAIFVFTDESSKLLADIKKEIDAGRGNPNDRGTLNVARILGIIGTVLLVLGVIWGLFIGFHHATMVGPARPGMPPGSNF